ncbi:MAG: tyrosine-type recombinase/integrase [Bacteroidetes bacterium]|nr:tyrosine-type recombinase/integrase [Bacteroidota bacterium]
MQEVIPKHQNKNSFLKATTREEQSLRSLHELFIKFKIYGSLKSNATIRNYTYNFYLLLCFKPQLTLTDLTEETIINFFAFLNNRERKVGKKLVVRTYKKSSIAIVRCSLNCFFEWLLERKYISSNPFKNIPFPSISYSDPRAFSSKEFEKICFAVNTKLEWSSLFVKKRNIAIIMFLMFTGVRKEELLNVKISDIDISRKIICINGETSKSKRTRLIPMSFKLIPYLQDYLNYRSKFACQYLWVSSTLDRPFTEYGVKYLINLLSCTTRINCHLHRFRHTFATNYYMQSHDIIGLKKLMGHKNLRMTMSYLRSIPDTHIAEQMNKLTMNEFI